MGTIFLVIYAFLNPHIYLNPFSAPTSPPANVVAMANSSTSIHVSWNEVSPIDQNGVIMSYEITYTPLENFTGVIRINSTNVSGSDLPVSLVGLQEYVYYSIQVRAYTSEGPGPYSAPVIQLTLEDSKSWINYLCLYNPTIYLNPFQLLLVLQLM